MLLPKKYKYVPWLIKNKSIWFNVKRSHEFDLYLLNLMRKDKIIAPKTGTTGISLDKHMDIARRIIESKN